MTVLHSYKKMEYIVPWETYQWISSLSIGGIMIVKQSNKYGLLNHKLELVQPIEFDTISNYPKKRHEQNFPSFLAKKNDKYYIFDTLGNWNDKIEYDNVKLLKANFYLVTKNGVNWRVDRNGTKIIEDFTVIRSDEYGFIAIKDSKFGLIGIWGEIILPFEYEDIICEHLGNIFVKKNGKWGVVNKKNQQFLPCNYDYIAYAWDDSDREDENKKNYIVVQNDKFGKVTKNGNVIFPFMYDGITTWVEYGPSGHYVMIDNKMGLIDYNGKIIIPIKYEKVEWIYDTDWAIIYDKGKIGLYNVKNNSFFLPLVYDYLYVDYFYLNKEKPISIITYKDGIVNILDKKGKIVRSKVPKIEIKKEFNKDIDAYHYSPCSYELRLMVHNKNFQVPECLKDSEYIYYEMRTNEF